MSECRLSPGLNTTYESSWLPTWFPDQIWQPKLLPRTNFGLTGEFKFNGPFTDNETFQVIIQLYKKLLYNLV